MLKLMSIITFLVFVLVGCVGTVETKKEQLTKGSVSGTQVLNYGGIENVIATSHDKVEVYFPVMAGDNDGSITYVVKYNSINSPKYFKSEDLIANKDARGNYRVIINDLALNYYYTFSVQVVDNYMNSSANIKVAETKTFSNKTADFYGVSSLQNLIGIEGANGIRVNWLAARKTGTFDIAPTDAVNYEIKIIEEYLGTGAFDDPSVDTNLIKVKYVSSNFISVDVNGLNPETSYYVRVRAIHNDYTKNSNDINYKIDSNNVIIKIKTYGLGDDVNVKNESFTAKSSAVSGTIEAAWDRAKGPFINYRLYYGKAASATSWDSYGQALNPTCSNLFDGAGWGCRTVAPESISGLITDLENFQSYKVVLVACVTVSCGPNSNTSSYVKYGEIDVTPNPIFANFLGVTSIEAARYYDELSTVYLKFDSPDFDTGAISGLYVKILPRITNNILESECILNDPVSDCIKNTPYSYSNFDYVTSTEIAIRGLDPETDDEYCFLILPFLDSPTERRVAEDIFFTKRCIVPKNQIKLPSLAEFTGIDSVTPNKSTSEVVVKWVPPTAGVYSKYHLFIYVGDGPFSFANAMMGAEGYLDIEIDYNVIVGDDGKISYSVGPISDVADGEILKFGLLVSNKSPNGEVTYSTAIEGENVKEIEW